VTGRFRANPTPIIERFFGGKECFFVQVGSYDGVTADPLHGLIKANPRWRGIFVEPQPRAFAELIANYGREDRFTFENIAIAEAAGELPFYSLSPQGFRETDIPSSFRVFSSLNREYVRKTIESVMRVYAPRVAVNAAHYVSEMLVRCEPLMSVLARNRVKQIDLLHVDAETYDFKIIRQIDFAVVAPKLILYEHIVLGEDANAARALLSRNGYRVVDCGSIDTIAVRRSP
jgi:FkbM family methyltransferase